MELSRAVLLAEFINEWSPRFVAKVLSFGSHGRVIVQDREDGTDRADQASWASRGLESAEAGDIYLEPVVDPADCLSRAEDGTLSLAPEYRVLLEEWLGITTHTEV